ncbi:MAG: DUF4105 domain-containing protein [Alloprevotella sp.]|nr:DUF4105 domain-containing protein [Alloprevotella sp.]
MMHTWLRTSLLFLVLLPFRGVAQQEVDSLRASLLTCAPGRESYALYGHTALRIARTDGQADWTFNYGVFDFNQRDFVWRFMMGRTDYTVSAVPTPTFLSLYAAEGREVTEQRLALSQQEIVRLLGLVNENVGTPGWTYRYNFLTDNCATRVIELIRSSLDGTLQFAPLDTALTYRRIIHRFADVPDPWGSFGQDLLLGRSVDTLLAVEGALAFPLCALEAVRTATVVRADGRRYALAAAPESLNATVSGEGLDGTGTARAAWVATPLVVSGVILLLSLLVSMLQWRGRFLPARIFDDMGMLLTGVAGCIVTLLFLFSALPSVGSNLLVVFLNPLPLLYLPWKMRNDRRGKADGYIPSVQFFLLSLCFVVAFLQDVPAAFLVLALSLLVRSVTYRELRRPKFPLWRRVVTYSVAFMAIVITALNIFRA